MENIIQLLENWKNISKTNKVLEKDYFIVKNIVYMIVAITYEKPFLFKTFTAKCPLIQEEIKNAISKLEQKKDELI